MRISRFFICLLLGVVMTPNVFSQTVTVECYDQDIIYAPDCKICNLARDYEVFTGLIVQKDAVRTKIYFPYEVKISKRNVLIYDSKGHNQFFSFNNTAQFADSVSFIAFLDLCHFPDNQVIDTFYRTGDTVNIKISNDPETKTILLPSGFVDTDNQNIDTFYIDGLDSLHIKLQRSARTWAVYLPSISGTGSDKQRFDTLFVLNDIAYYSLQRDSVAALQMDLHRYLDSIKQFYISGDSLVVRIGQDSRKFVLFSAFDTDSQSLYQVGQDSIGIFRGNRIKIIENQFLDTFAIVSNILRASIKDDQLPFSSVDLSAYVAQTWGNAGVTNWIGTLSGGGGSTIFNGTNGIRILNGASGNVSIDGLNLQWVAAATTGTSQTIGNAANPETVTWVGGGINTTSISANTITITGTEIDGDVTNELQDFFQSSLTIGLTNSSSTFRLIAGSNLTITPGGTSNNSTFTISSSYVDTDTDNYVDSVTFNNSTKILYLGRTGVLSTLSDTINFTDIDTQRVLVFARHGDTVMIRVTNDTLKYITLPATDTQKVIAFYRNLDSLFVQITNDVPHFLIVKDSFQINTDSQKIVRFERSGDTLFIRIDNDVSHYLILPPGFIDTDTDSQSLSLVVDSLHISRGNSVSLAKYIDPQQTLTSSGVGELITVLSLSGGSFNLKGGGNITITRSGTGSDAIATISSMYTDNQYLDTFEIVSNILRASIFGDNKPFSFVDLSPYINVGTNITYTQLSNFINSSTGTGDAITGFGDTINILSGLGDKDSQYGTANQLLISTGTGLVDWSSLIAGNKISISGLTITNTGDTSNINELQVLNSISLTTTLSLGGGSIQFIQGGNISITQAGTGLNATYTFAANDNQYIDTFDIVSNILRASIFGDNRPFSFVDLSPYVDAAQVLNTVSKVMSLSLSGGSVQFIETTGISITQGGTGLNASLTWSVLDQSATNEAQPWTNSGTSTWVGTLGAISGIGGGSFSVTGSTGIAVSHISNAVILSVNDKDSTNELQDFNSVALVVGLTKSSSNVTFIEGTNITITKGGSASNATYTFASSAVIVDSQSLYIPHIDSLGITRGNKVFIDENQYLDTFGIVANILRASIFGDRQAFKFVDLSPYIDAAQTLNTAALTTTLSLSGGSFSLIAGNNIGITQNTSGLNGSYTISSTGGNQYPDTFAIVSNILRLSIFNDLIPFVSVNLAPYLDNTDFQYHDTFAIVSNILRSSIFGDNRPFSSVDLSPYIDAAQTLNTASNTTSLSLSGGSVTYLTNTGISVSTTTAGLNASLTFSVIDQSITNEGLIGVADGDVTPSTSSQIISNTSTQSPINIRVGGILAISETVGSNGGTINLNAVEVQALNTASFVTTLTGGTSVQYLAPGPGISIAQSGTGANASLTWSVTDQSASNELQDLNTILDTIKLTQSSSSVRLVAGNNVTITRAGTLLNSSYTFASQDSQSLYRAGGDSVGITRGNRIKINNYYADSLTFNSTTNILTLGRTDTLSSLTALLNIAGDSDWWKRRNLIPNNSDTMYHVGEFNAFGGDTTPNTALDVMGDFTLANKRGSGNGTRIDMIFDNISPATTDWDYHIDYWMGNSDLDATTLKLYGFIDYVVHNALSNNSTTYGEFGFSVQSTLGPVFPLRLIRDTTIVHLLNVQQSLYDKNYSVGSLKNILTSTVDGVRWLPIDSVLTSGITNQTIDTFAIVSNILRASISGDNQPFKFVDLSSYIDAAQTINTASKVMTLSLSGGSLTFIESSGVTITQGGTGLNASLTFAVADQSASNEIQDYSASGLVLGLTQSSSSVTFAAGTNMTSIVQTGTATNPTYTFNASSSGSSVQYFDTAAIVSNVLRLSLFNDNKPFSAVDLSAYVSQTLSTVAKTTTLSLSGGSLQFIESSGITITQTGSALAAIYTLAVNDKDSTNEIQTYNASGLVLGLTQSSSSVTFAAGTNMTSIVQTGTATNPTYTFNATGGGGGGSSTLDPFITNDTTGFILQTSHDTVEFVFTGTGGGGGGGGGTLSSVGIINGGGITVSGSPLTSNGSITLTAADQSNTNEGVLTATDGTFTTKIINSSGGGSSSFSAITLGVSGILAISRSGNTINFSGTEAQTLSLSGQVLTISGTGSTVTLPGGNTDITFGTATTTQDSLRSNTGTDVLFKVGGTLLIDVANSNSGQLTIYDNKIWYSIPNFSSTAVVATTIASSTSPTLAANSLYRVIYTSFVNNSATANMLLKLISSVGGWTISGFYQDVTSTGVIGGGGQAVGVVGYGGTIHPSANAYIRGEYLVKTDATAGTLSWQIQGQSGTTSLTDLRCTIEKL